MFRPRRSLVIAFGLALAAGAGGCREDDESRREWPAPPEPPEPPEPPDAPEAPRSLATHYFELPAEGEDRLSAELELALGRIETARAESGYLFQAEVMLPEGPMRPRFAARRTGRSAQVSLSLDDATLSPRGMRRAENARWLVYLPSETPTDLSMSLGASQAVLDLSGVPVSNLDLDCGLSRADLRFDTPNPIEMDKLSIQAGLAEFRADGLGNARFNRMSFEGGAGRFALDFSGAQLATDAIADIDVGMADLLITLPAGQPISVHTPESAFVRVSVPEGYVRGHGSWDSPEASDADEVFRIHVDSGPGRVELRVAE